MVFCYDSCNDKVFSAMTCNFLRAFMVVEWSGTGTRLNGCGMGLVQLDKFVA